MQTDPKLEMARRIAADIIAPHDCTMRDKILSGLAGDSKSVRIALAAIEECTEAHEQEARLLRREIADGHYMMEAYRQMLGPKGRQVAKLWADQGIIQQHSSWTVDPYSLTGEDVAGIHLAFEAAPKTRIDNIDAHLKGPTDA